jgi:translation initiation factor IF-1
MVKNTIGGCKSKKIARKLTISYDTKKEATRLATNELEEYAFVSKMYGNGRCQIKTHNGLDLQCVIRNKFRGRSKRGNVVITGSYILIGLREWEIKTGCKTCDLLEIYDTEDVFVLNNQPEFKKLVLITNTDKIIDDDLFSNNIILEQEEENTVIKKKQQENTIILQQQQQEDNKEEEINFDDI